MGTSSPISRSGPPVVRAIRRVATRPLDVHLMIEDPDRYIEEFVAAGASMVSVHVEAVRHLHRTVSLIRKLGAKAGVVINPATPAAIARSDCPRCGLRARHVGEPGLFRPGVHPTQPREAAAGAQRAGERRLLSAHRDRWRYRPVERELTSLPPAQTSSWLARPSSAAQIRKPRRVPCARPPINWLVDSG